MNSNINMRCVGLLSLFTVFFQLNGFAQTAVFSASASASKIGEKDDLQVDYTIQNVQNLRTFNQPSFKDFNVVQGSPFSQQSSNISIVGNKMVQTQSITYSYILQPKHTGTLHVPAASVKDADGNTYQSNSLTIEVVNGSLASRQRQSAQPFDPFDDDPFVAMMRQRQMMHQRQAAPNAQKPSNQNKNVPLDEIVNEDISKDLFIKVNVDKQKAYVGEQITASYKLYARLPMNVGISKLPSLNGFWTQDFERPNGNLPPTEEVINGKKYQVFLLKKSALFPQQSGVLILDPAEAEGTARIMQKIKQRNPFGDMFDDPFFQQFGSLMMSDPFFNDDVFSTLAYKDIPVKLKSTPIKINVLPLPEKQKPASFGNAVGNFTIDAKVDKTKMTTDDVLTLNVTISGSGNIKLIEAPQIKLPNGLSTYDPQIIDTITGRTTTISGSKIITYLISSNLVGDFEIPSIPFSYYNPQIGKFVTIETNSIKVQVAKGKQIKSIASNRSKMGDVQPIILAPLDSLKPAAEPILYSVGYWSMYALPLFAFIGLSFYKKREEELFKDGVKLRHKRANKVALKRLATAQKLLQTNAKQAFYEEVSKAIWLYLSDKLNIPLASLSREAAFESLNQKNVPVSLQDKLHQMITECETALYAPGSSAEGMKSAYTDVVQLISELEESIVA